MANLEKVEVLVPESHSISTRVTVQSNYGITRQVNDAGATLKRTRSFEISMGELGIMSFSQILPAGNKDAEAAICGIHSGDSFRLAHRGVTPASTSSTTPSGGPKSGNRAVKGYFNSPIILWATFIKQESNALYEGVEFPDLTDRASLGEREQNFTKMKETVTTEENNASLEEEIPY